MARQEEFDLRKLVVPAAVAIVFWALGAAMWQFSGYIEAMFFFGYIGTSIGVGLGLYASLPRKQKPWGRRLTLFLVGGFLLVGMGILGGENIQIEGMFFALLAGFFGAALTHYLIAKVFGPLFFGRLWCGWACWTVMILDLLPFKRSPGRVPGRWGHFRYLHFALSLGLVLALWFGLSYRLEGAATLIWLLAGNALYYGAGIALAFALRDNRAFCKYVCPITVLLKAGARFSLLKIGGEAEECNGCQACDRMCPVDIRISDYVQQGQRVLSTECTLCQTCITVCPTDTLKLSFGWDVGGKERLRERS